MQKLFRLDFNGRSQNFSRTPQGFLRVKARLTKAGVFSYGDTKEYRPSEEIFKEDFLSSLKGAPITDLHPSETGADCFLNSKNVKEHIIGLTENVEADGDYLTGSLLIFHEDSINAIESGARKEISLGYQCELQHLPGVIEGKSYDAIQKNIIVNHVAIGPKGWGRVGPQCAIKTDSKKETIMETVRLDGHDIALNKEDIKKFFDTMSQNLANETKKRQELENPKFIEQKIQERLRLDTLKKAYPNLDLNNKEPSFLEGMYEAMQNIPEQRNDSLNSTRQAIFNDEQKNNAYETWIEQSSKLWATPLTASK